MFRREELPVFIKRILLFAIVLLAAMLQNTDGLLPGFFSARLFVLIPVTVAIGMCEGEMSGLIYGLIGGCFWDICAGGPDGIFALMLGITGCFTGLLVRFIMRNRLLSQYCICAVSSVLCCVIYWFFAVYLTVGDSDYNKLRLFYLPSAVITTAFSFITYYIIRFVSEKLTDRENKTV